MGERGMADMAEMECPLAGPNRTDDDRRRTAWARWRWVACSRMLKVAGRPAAGIIAILAGTSSPHRQPRPLNGPGHWLSPHASQIRSTATGKAAVK